jgi:hypothetical protein
MNIHQAGEFGKIKGNLQYLIRNCENEFNKETLKETKTMVENLYKELIK